ncbi:MAG: hypothetical protein ACKPKO_12255, partial [Candidatus Fonsibacter sp.]
MSDLREEERADWQRPRDFLDQKERNYVHILVYEECTEIDKDSINTPAGKFKAVPQSAGALDMLASRGIPGRWGIMRP